jgi:phosphate-selective porin OprO/OprP
MRYRQFTALWTAMGLALYAASPAVATASTTETKLSNSLKFSSDDGNFKMQLGGRLMADAAWYNQDNVKLDGQNGTEFRRARLFVKGTMYGVWHYKAQYDFAASDEIKDAYIRYTGFEPLRITVGQFKQPSSLEDLTSSKYITFMERALPNAFATGRRIGLGVDRDTDHYTLAASVYGQNADSSSTGDEGYGVGARGTWAPWNEEGRVLHLGLWGAWEQPNDVDAGGGTTDQELRFRERPESHITSTRLVNTGEMSQVDNFTKYGLEAAAVMGPFSVQSEYISTTVQTDDPAISSDPDFSGWYVYGSWFLTGESRPYKHGTFGRVKPKSIVGAGGTGAWEVAVRYSSLDLHDSGVQGGEEDNITVGVNWYATSHVRFMANYIHANADPFTQEASLNVAPNQNDDSPDIFQVRAQIDF